MKSLYLLILFFTLFLYWGCANTAKNTSGSDFSAVFLNEETYLLTIQSEDSAYGFTASNPIKVGGYNEESGPRNQRRFMNALLGPGGETVFYARDSSCCGFETPNGILGMGMLDVYNVTWQGSQDTLQVYINMYDKGELKIPVGFTARSE